MSKVVVINHVTLDGVMQSPGRPEEDTRGGFTHGGWSVPNVDDQLMAATYARVEEGGGLQLLLGRRSYEGMLGYWNTQDSPSKKGSTTRPSTSHLPLRRRDSSGRTQACCTAMSPPPSSNSSRALPAT